MATRFLEILSNRFGVSQVPGTKTLVLIGICVIGFGVLAFSAFRAFVPPAHDVVPLETAAANLEAAEIESIAQMSPAALEDHMRGLRRLIDKLSADGGDSHELEHFKWQLEVATKFKQSKGT
ncbi:MAG TPA: hypothetical protein VD971_00935 [Phycisphaerales bacterium]|nr:hypothetical protein [Phycisphaerales bacterium]